MSDDDALERWSRLLEDADGDEFSRVHALLVAAALVDQALSDEYGEGKFKERLKRAREGDLAKYTSAVSAAWDLRNDVAHSAQVPSNRSVRDAVVPLGHLHMMLSGDPGAAEAFGLQAKSSRIESTASATSERKLNLVDARGMLCAESSLGDDAKRWSVSLVLAAALIDEQLCKRAQALHDAALDELPSFGARIDYANERGWLATHSEHMSEALHIRNKYAHEGELAAEPTFDHVEQLISVAEELSAGTDEILQHQEAERRRREAMAEQRRIEEAKAQAEVACQRELYSSARRRQLNVMKWGTLAAIGAGVLIHIFGGKGRGKSDVSGPLPGPKTVSVTIQVSVGHQSVMPSLNLFAKVGGRTHEKTCHTNWQSPHCKLTVVDENVIPGDEVEIAITDGILFRTTLFERTVPVNAKAEAISHGDMKEGCHMTADIHITDPAAEFSSGVTSAAVRPPGEVVGASSAETNARQTELGYELGNALDGTGVTAWCTEYFPGLKLKMYFGEGRYVTGIAVSGGWSYRRKYIDGTVDDEWLRNATVTKMAIEWGYEPDRTLIKPIKKPSRGSSVVAFDRNADFAKPKTVVVGQEISYAVVSILEIDGGARQVKRICLDDVAIRGLNSGFPGHPSGSNGGCAAPETKQCRQRGYRSCLTFPDESALAGAEGNAECVKLKQAGTPKWLACCP